MSPPNTDPWTAPIADESSTAVRQADGSVPTRDQTTQAGAAAPSRRTTDPGLGDGTTGPLAAHDTAVDGAKPWASDDTWDDGPTDDEGLAGPLDDFAGRARQHAAFQAESAGRSAAVYAGVAKPARSRAAERTAPLGVIVASDTRTPRPAMPVLAAQAVVTAPVEPDASAFAQREQMVDGGIRPRRDEQVTEPAARRVRTPATKTRTVTIALASLVLLLAAVGLVYAVGFGAPATSEGGATTAPSSLGVATVPSFSAKPPAAAQPPAPTPVTTAPVVAATAVAASPTVSTPHPLPAPPAIAPPHSSGGRIPASSASAKPSTDPFPKATPRPPASSPPVAPEPVHDTARGI